MDKLLLFGEESERLIFRKLEFSDFDNWLPLFHEKQAALFLGMNVEASPKESCESWFEKSMWRYDQKKGGMNVLVNKETGELVGQSGLLIQEVNELEMIEIGYSILPKFWGKGYASEAAQKCKHFAFENRLASHLISVVHKDNHASAKVASNNGMKLWQHIQNYKEMPVNIFRVEK